MAKLQNMTKKQLIALVEERDEMLKNQTKNWEGRLEEIKRKCDSHVRGIGKHLDDVKSDLNKTRHDLKNSSVMNRALMSYSKGLEEMIDANKE